MTNERAIELLNRISDSQFDGEYGDERREALEMAVRALEGDGDTISRQAVMKEFSDFVRKSNNSDFAQTPTWNDAVSLVGSMPSAQPQSTMGQVNDTVQSTKDCISRQQAIDALDEQIAQCNKAIKSFVLSMKDEYAAKVEKASLTAFRERLEYMPPAQPEIIRCTECKHYREYDSKYVENAVVVQCMADRYPISEIIPDGWFCAGAERKDDE